MAARAFQLSGQHSPELAIEHVREPRHRMPVRSVAQMKRPPNIFPRQPAADVGVVDDVIRIVDVGEFEVSRLPIDRERDRGQCQANQQCCPVGSLRRRLHIRDRSRTGSTPSDFGRMRPVDADSLAHGDVIAGMGSEFKNAMAEWSRSRGGSS